MSTRFDLDYKVDSEERSLCRQQSGELNFFVVTQFHNQLQLKYNLVIICGNLLE